MSEKLFTVLWKQWPAGWHIRSFDAKDGHYVAELLSEYPRFRALTSGTFFPWDKFQIIELGEKLLSLAGKSELLAPPPSYVGFFGEKPSSINQQGAYYHYVPGATEDQKSKLFLEMVAIVEPYFSNLNFMVRCRRELYESE